MECLLIGQSRPFSVAVKQLRPTRQILAIADSKLFRCSEDVQEKRKIWVALFTDVVGSSYLLSTQSDTVLFYPQTLD